MLYVLHYLLDSLKAGGTTAMMDGLLESLKEILQNGKWCFNIILLAIIQSSNHSSLFWYLTYNVSLKMPLIQSMTCLYCSLQ